MYAAEQMVELHKKAASHYTPEELHDYGEEQMLELCLCFADDSTEKMMKMHQLCKTLIALNTLRQQYIKEHEQLFAGIEEAAYNDLLNMLNDQDERGRR